MKSFISLVVLVYAILFPLCYVLERFVISPVTGLLARALGEKYEKEN